MGRILLSHPLQVVEYTIQQLPLPPNKLCNTLFSTLLTSPSSLLPLLTPSLSTSLLTASFTKLWVYDALAKVKFCQLCDRYSGFQAALFRALFTAVQWSITIFCLALTEKLICISFISVNLFNELSCFELSSAVITS